MDSLADALQLYRAGRALEAEDACLRILAHDPRHIDALALLADIRLAAGRSETAIAALAQLAQLRPDDAANLRRLGSALYSARRTPEAIAALRHAVALEPDNARGHGNLGFVLLQAASAGDAIPHLERAVALDPGYAIGHNNLGLALLAQRRHDAAIAAFQHACERDASLLHARINLVTALDLAGRHESALQALGRILAAHPADPEVLTAGGSLQLRHHRGAAALESFDAALSLRPADAALHAQRAAALAMQERSAEALCAIDRSLDLNAGDADALHVKAGILCRLNRPSDALQCLDLALRENSGNPALWCDRAVAQLQLGDDAAAVHSYCRAIALDQDLVAARTGLISALIPAVPRSTDDALRARAGFTRELASFESWLAAHALGEDDAWAVARQQFFYLSYREVSNRELLLRYRRASAARLQHWLPPAAAPAQRSPALRRLRLGIVSAHVFDHSVFNAIVHGWLRHLDRADFETTVFSLAARQDAMTHEAATLVDRFETGAGSARDWAQRILDRKPDVLIYPEVGIDRTTLALANLRLADRQLASWGHPETTGLPTIDAFLSAECFEPGDADQHYTETLVRLPGLGVQYISPGDGAAGVDLAALGIDRALHSRPLFVCPGTPFKYQPDDDRMLVDIATRVGPCTFVFFAFERAALNRQLQERLATAFRRAGLDPARFLAWIPWQPRPAFLGVLSQTDVYLDTIGFSGFNTLMHAVEAGLPAVAYEGRFLRGRLGSGVLRHFGFGELVAGTKADYVDIATRLALDAGRRARIRERLGAVAERGLPVGGAVTALARLLLSA